MAGKGGFGVLVSSSGNCMKDKDLWQRMGMDQMCLFTLLPLALVFAPINRSGLGLRSNRGNGEKGKRKRGLDGPHMCMLQPNAYFE